ncbi:diacylglycerol kinase [Methylophaga sp. OBS3]|uniref:diacylglycerol kinase n=1 Tax=Methylophaga sp. OBS3 TaxID=2991934 RepID=UPI002250EBE3|nr:diacylglycerol kinase [Methylophaga sp. OBS3]MCX4189623.1 diacylglycerol kinase [Methylophaga sp. OBS3]
MQKKTGITRLLYAAKHSSNGFISALNSEAAFRQEFIAVSVLAILSFWLPVTALEQVLLLSTLVMVLIVELINSAIECLADQISSEWHLLIKKAKDYGSLAVLLTLLISASIWLTILLPKFNF